MTSVGIVLAAGKGTRLKSDLPKVLHPVLGKPILQRVLESLVPLGLDRIIVVVGHQADSIQAALPTFQLPIPIECVVQAPQLGTGHALMQVSSVLPPNAETQVLITCGDMPLVPTERYQQLLDAAKQDNAVASLVTVAVKNPTGYGRVLFDNNQFEAIVEEKDATAEQKACSWINAGIYAAQWPVLSTVLNQLTQNNAQGEFYLTDAFGLIRQQKGPGSISTVIWPHEQEVLGINSREQLSEAGDILSCWTAQRLMAEGVSLINPTSMTLAPEISVGPDTVIFPGCTLLGAVQIGDHCEIGPHTTMKGQITVGNYSKVIQSYLDRLVTIGSHTAIGPFAHLRDNAVIGHTVKIGNFVEVKETVFGDRSNAAHLSYLGDVTVGMDVNIGAGVIIANYDPIRDLKHRSTIEDEVKIGCNSVIVSPLVLRRGSCVAAGSVITSDVSPWDLAIARSRQTTHPDWVQKVREKASASPSA